MNPPGGQSVAGGKRSAAPGKTATRNKPQGGGKLCMRDSCRPCQGSFIAGSPPRAARYGTAVPSHLPPATIFCPGAALFDSSATF